MPNEDYTRPKQRYCVICGAELRHRGYPRFCDDPECEREYAREMDRERQERHEEIDAEYGYGY